MCIGPPLVFGSLVCFTTQIIIYYFSLTFHLGLINKYIIHTECLSSFKEKYGLLKSHRTERYSYNTTLDKCTNNVKK